MTDAETGARFKAKLDADVERRVSAWVGGRELDPQTVAEMRAVCLRDAVGAPDNFTRFHINQRLA